MKTASKTLATISRFETARQCLSCGTTDALGRKWYCSESCRRELCRGLEILNSLLRALAARYATFFFDDTVLVLDVLTQSAKTGHRFIYQRGPGLKPAQDLRQMINEMGDLWWEKKRCTGKRYRASQQVLDTAAKKDIPSHLVKPVEIARPHRVVKSLKYLKLTIGDLHSHNARETVKSAYRRQALRHHPDRGGNSSSFHELRIAYEDVVSWLDAPRVRTRTGIPGKWCFDGRKWRSPLRTRQEWAQSRP